MVPPAAPAEGNPILPSAGTGTWASVRFPDTGSSSCPSDPWLSDLELGKGTPLQEGESCLLGVSVKCTLENCRVWTRADRRVLQIC